MCAYWLRQFENVIFKFYCAAAVLRIATICFISGLPREASNQSKIENILPVKFR